MKASGEPFLEEFLDGCGCAGPLSLVVEEASGNELARPSLQQPFALIGSDAENNVVLEDAHISPRHVYLQAVAGGIFCVDLKSQTRTYWPEGPRPFGWITQNQFLRLGNHKVRLLKGESLGSVPGTFDPMVAGSVQLPLLTLEFSHGRTTRSQWPMNRVLALIGTSTQCKVRLHNRGGVARFHASLVCTPKGTWVVDLLGPAGTYVNGKRIRCARLEDDDELAISDFKIRVRCQPESTYALQANSDLPNEEVASALVQTFSKGNAFRTPVQAPLSLPAGENNPGKALLEAVLLPVVQQFNLMQNQMFDQFREAMVMMFQMFGSLQKEQMEFVRGELGRVQELSQEIQTLQAELKKNPPSRSAQVNFDVPSEFGPETRQQEVQLETKTLSPTSTGKVSDEHDQLAASAKSGGVTEGKSGPEVHAWLAKRMAEMQEDRRSRLQKILHFVSGK